MWFMCYGKRAVGAAQREDGPGRLRLHLPPLPVGEQRQPLAAPRSVHVDFQPVLKSQKGVLNRWLAKEATRLSVGAVLQQSTPRLPTAVVPNPGLSDFCMRV